MVLHYTEPFIIILPSSRFELNNVEKDVNQQISIIVTDIQYLGKHNTLTICNIWAIKTYKHRYTVRLMSAHIER